MRILVITARFPPYHLGGYEIRIENILDGLVHRGHEILVISSIKETKSKSSTSISKYKIIRQLHIRKNSRPFFYELILDLFDVAFLDYKIKSFRPDIIYLGHTICLSKALMPYLAGLQIPIVYDEGGRGLAFIKKLFNRGLYFYNNEEDPGLKKFLKNNINTITCFFSLNLIRPTWTWPRNMRVFFNSAYSKKYAQDNGVPVEDSQVIYSAIDNSKFSYKSRNAISSPIKLIIPGRVAPEKGTKDALQLLLKLKEEKIPTTLFVIGKNFSNAYYDEILREVEKLKLKEDICILPMVSHDELAILYQESDICFFPSYQKYGLSRVPLEAMACGCLVMTYGNEGSNEIIQSGETGLIISEGDFTSAVVFIKGLIQNTDRYEKIVQTARLEIEKKYTMNHYIDTIETYLFK